MERKLQCLFILCLIFQFSLSSQNDKFDTWNVVTSLPNNVSYHLKDASPEEFTIYQLNIDNLYNELSDAPNRNSSSITNGIILDLPFNGGLDKFEVYSAPVLDEQLQSQIPLVQSYIGRLLRDKKVVIRFSLSKIKGFNAIILNDIEGTRYIDSYTSDNKYCISYKKKDIFFGNEINCLNSSDDSFSFSQDFEEVNNQSRHVNDGVMREFRLALACTQEYSQYHISQLGLTSATDAVKKAAILAIMNDIMTRVNAVYENELSLTMVIVPNNSNVIFLQDTFLSNNDIGTLINQSQTYIDVFVGSANYDIGHMLSTSGSGLAQLYSPCTNNKARAVSGGLSSIPEGIVFENVIMHEMGHQYGAFHTYNSNNCASAASSNSAYEPGSGTTIMSYAGICGSNANIQATQDTYFHQNSIAQMWENLTIGNSTCAQQIITNNSEPTADAGSDYVIPIGTPYKLSGLGNDSDILGLTYSWEEFDLGASAAAPTNFTTTGPVVRSFPPSENNFRYIPRLQDYVNNVNSSTSWEKLMLINRDLNFSFTVRDNDLLGGQAAVDFMLVTVNNSGGPFTVTSQNTSGVVYSGGTLQTVTWNVSGTDASPFNSSNVNVLLSTDGGLSFDTVLLANTPNDGTEEVILPNINSSSCRIMVESVENIFFNINSEDFEIEESLSVEDYMFNNLSIYPNPNIGRFQIEFDVRTTDSVEIDIFDINGRVIKSKRYENVASKFKADIDLGNISAGVYLVKITNGLANITSKLIIN